MVLLSIFAITLVAAVVVTIVLGIRAAALRAGHPRAVSARMAGKGMAMLVAWLGASAALALTGALGDFEARPPRLLLAVAASATFLVLTSRTTTFRALLAATPASWPVALMTMRVPIELGLYGLYVEGRLPVHLTFEGRNFDVLVGATAPFVAWALGRGLLGRRGLLAWNVVSLGLLANVVGMAITSVPGPLHLAWPGVPNTVVATFPWVWLPTFLVPVALFGHVSSLRQLLGGEVSSSRAPA
ncbi:MAG: hypothetical protein JST00_23660 [Deltaproteobacteria bacterium]|nr:hypothetical protein [Deltaproteobacteria bacterium]